MRKLFVPLLAAVLGTHACPVDIALAAEVRITAVIPVRDTPNGAPCGAAVSATAGTLDLPALWDLALANNPSLRQAAAEVEAARGGLIQARKYPNPTIAYSQEALGTKAEAAGILRLELTQTIVTGGKRPLDIAINARGLDAASVARFGQRFTALTNLRSAYYDYLGWAYTVRVNEEVLTRLEQGLQVIRKLVEAKTRPRTDLLQIEGLAAQARLNLANSRASQEAAWRQVAARVGVPQLPMPDAAANLPEVIPVWDADAVVRRVLATNTSLKQAAVLSEQARLQIERARAAAVPDMTVGGGFSWGFSDPEGETGAIVSLSSALPLWDRKQGLIHEAEANRAKAQAAVRTTADQLRFDTAAAFGRYVTARQQVEQLTTAIVPQLQESLDILRENYRKGAAQVTFTDVLLAEQSLLTSRLTLAAARRSLWLAVAELEGVMQLDLGEEFALPGKPCN